MKLQHVYVGAWLPKTILHFKEFYYFLSTGKSKQDVSQNMLEHHYEELGVERVKTREGATNVIEGVAKGNEFAYLENGTFFVRHEVNAKSLVKDVSKQIDFFFDTMLPAFNFLYQSDASFVNKYIRDKEDAEVVIVASAATKKEIQDVYAKFDDEVYQSVEEDAFNIYYGAKIIFVLIKKPRSVSLEQLVQYVMFIADFEKQMKKSLDAQRKVWEGIVDIREQKRIPYKELSTIRDYLLDKRLEANFHITYLKQIDDYLEDRLRLIDTFMKHKKLQTVVSEELHTMYSTRNYLLDLWKLSEEYIRSTITLVELLYTEKQQKILGTLQLLFLFGAMGGLFSLGTLAGGKIVLEDRVNDIVLEGVFSSFNSLAMWYYIILAVIATLLLYFIINSVFVRRKSKPIDYQRIRRHKLEAIESKMDRLWGRLTR